jgi:hypothetical protein
MSANSFDALNSFCDLSFVAGTEKTLTFPVYEDDGVTPLDISSGSAIWRICPYGEFKTTVLTKEATKPTNYSFSVGLTESDTLSISRHLETTSNLILNPSLEIDTTDWVWAANALGTGYGRTTLDPYIGRACGKAVCSGTGSRYVVKNALIHRSEDRKSTRLNSSHH